MSDLPEYAMDTTVEEIEQLMVAAGYGIIIHLPRREVALMMFKAGEKAVRNLNATLAQEISEERVRIFTNLRKLPGCLITTSALMKAVGLPQ